GAGPAFLIALKTLMVPVAMVVVGAVTLGTTRSGCTTVIGVAVAVTLLPSSCSVTWWRASAKTRTKYWPGDVLAGMVSGVMAVDDVPAVRAGTARLPRRTSVPSRS